MAESREVGDEVVGGEVGGGEEVLLVAKVFLDAVDDELVGEAAGLGALAAVGGAASQRFGGEALSGVGDAEGAMDEDFEFGRGGCATCWASPAANRVR